MYKSCLKAEKIDPNQPYIETNLDKKRQSLGVQSVDKSKDAVPKVESLPQKDQINPDHYQSGAGLECIDAIVAATEGKSGREGYLVGNVIKYLWRYEKKGGVTSVEKAQWYIERLIKELRDGKGKD